MVDKITFMETLHSVQEIARTSTEPMTKEEIRGYFQDMELSEEQQEMIYQFLLTPQEESVENEDNTEQADAGTEAKSRESARHKPAVKTAGQSLNPHFQMYLKEISAVDILPKEQQTDLYRQLLSGEETAIEEISHQWLKKIIKIAGEFVTPRVLLEDLVQEGNIALLLGLGQLLGKALEYGADNAEILDDAQQTCLEKRLESFVREGMESYRQELEGEADSENTILAKVSLIHEAQKALAEENGTVPTVQELCEYTRIPQEEIVDILDLHDKARKE